MNKYFILMGDIKNSRKINSDKLTIILEEILMKTEKKFKNKIITKLEVKLGDDFQVVLNDINSLLLILLYLDILFLSKKIECRYALGYGDISGTMNKESRSSIRGLGLTNIDEILKHKDKKYSFFIQDNICKTILLDTIGLLLEDVLSNLTEKQINFLYYKVIEDKSLNEIQNLMKVKQRAVYYIAKRSKYSLIMNIFENIQLTFTSNLLNLENKYFEGFILDKGEYNG